jgi:hypothetical protein
MSSKKVISAETDKSILKPMMATDKVNLQSVVKISNDTSEIQSQIQEINERIKSHRIECISLPRTLGSSTARRMHRLEIVALQEKKAKLENDLQKNRDLMRSDYSNSMLKAKLDKISSQYSSEGNSRRYKPYVENAVVKFLNKLLSDHADTLSELKTLAGDETEQGIEVFNLQLNRTMRDVDIITSTKVNANPDYKIAYLKRIRTTIKNWDINSPVEILC